MPCDARLPKSTGLQAAIKAPKAPLVEPSMQLTAQPPGCRVPLCRKQCKLPCSYATHIPSLRVCRLQERKPGIHWPRGFIHPGFEAQEPSSAESSGTHRRLAGSTRAVQC